MLNILLVAATPFEIAPLTAKFSKAGINQYGLEQYNFNTHRFTVLVSGVGMVATAFALGRHLTASYDLALNIGIAGSFSHNLHIGDVVTVYEDCFAELGAEDGEGFLTIDQLNLGISSIKTTAGGISNTVLEQLPVVNAITVNKVHGNETSIANVMERLHPVIESMEGAAFFYACEKSAIPCAQLRAVSNYVEKRNKASWNIPLAIARLNETAERVLLAF